MAKKPDNIKLLILDVDGVLTDGSVILTDEGKELMSFNAKDGAAIKWWMRCGRQMAWISGRKPPAVLARARNLGVEHVYQHVLDKLPVYKQLLEKLGVCAQDTAYVGDDLMDLPIMSRCGFSIAVADAAQELRDTADLITEHRGGRGAVAEVVRLLLRATGDWESIIMTRYQRSD